MKFVIYTLELFFAYAAARFFVGREIDTMGPSFSDLRWFVIPLALTLGGVAVVSSRVKQEKDGVLAGIGLERLLELFGVIPIYGAILGIPMVIWTVSWIQCTPPQINKWSITLGITGILMVIVSTTSFYDMYCRVKRFFRPSSSEGKFYSAVAKYQAYLGWSVIVLAGWWTYVAW